MNAQFSKAARRTRARLRERFPNCFCARGFDKWPIKLGIEFDIYERCPELDPHDVRLAIADYCSGEKYLKAMTRGAIRRDLDGNPAGHVSGKDAQRALQKLATQVANTRRQRAGNAPAAAPGQDARGLASQAP